MPFNIIRSQTVYIKGKLESWKREADKTGSNQAYAMVFYGLLTNGYKWIKSEICEKITILL